MNSHPLLIIPVWAGIGREKASPAADACRAAIITQPDDLAPFCRRRDLHSTCLPVPSRGRDRVPCRLAGGRTKTEFFRKPGWGAALTSFWQHRDFLSLSSTHHDRCEHHCFFPDELKGARHNLEGGSSAISHRGALLGIFNDCARNLIGALVCVRSGRDERRRFALATFILAGQYLVAFRGAAFRGWSSPIPIYFEYTPVGGLSEYFVVFFLLPSQGCFGSVSIATLQFFGTVAVAAVAVVSGSRVSCGSRRRPCGGPTMTARTSTTARPATALAEYLRDKVAIAVGSPFRGRVAAMTGQAWPNIAGGDVHST